MVQSLMPPLDPGFVSSQINTAVVKEQQRQQQQQQQMTAWDQHQCSTPLGGRASQHTSFDNNWPRKATN
jgi:hypothetical protein